MTAREVLEQEAPDYLRSLRRERILAAVVALVAGVALGMAVFAVVVNVDQGDRITKVERSVCNRAPESKACARVREEVARAEPIKNACIPYQRVTGERGRNCPRGFTRQRGEVVPQKPTTTAPQQPGPGSDRGDGGQRPSTPPSTPRNTPPRTPQAPPVIVNPPPVPSTPAPSPPAPIRETVEGVTDTACQVTQPVTGICLK